MHDLSIALARQVRNAVLSGSSGDVPIDVEIRWSDATELLDLAEESLNEIACPVSLPIKRPQQLPAWRTSTK